MLSTFINFLNKKLFLTLGCISTVGLYSANTFSQGEPVNCQEEITEIPYFQGWASCYDHDTHNWLTEYFAFRVYSLIVTIQDPLDVNSSCTAFVETTGYERVVKEVCDYTPDVSLSVFRLPGTTNSVIHLKGEDRDGEIVKEEIWVDGVKKTGSSVKINGNAGDTFQVKGRVTDNQGYTDEVTKTVTLVYRPPLGCSPWCGR